MLGPLLVLVFMYINDLPENIISQVRLFADDTVVYLISEGANDSLPLQNDLVVGNPIGKKTLIFTFDGKIEYINLPMLILFLDMWQNTYGWMPTL